MIMLVSTGYLLKQAYSKNNELKIEANSWKYASESINKAYQELNKKLEKRDVEYRLLQAKSRSKHKEIKEIIDETKCLDTEHPVAIGLQFNPDYSKLPR